MRPMPGTQPNGDKLFGSGGILTGLCLVSTTT
jgi:hypothetical protein